MLKGEQKQGKKDGKVKGEGWRWEGYSVHRKVSWPRKISCQKKLGVGESKSANAKTLEARPPRKKVDHHCRKFI